MAFNIPGTARELQEGMPATATMPDGTRVVTPRLPQPNAPVILVDPAGRVVRGTADLALTADKMGIEVSNVRKR